MTFRLKFLLENSRLAKTFAILEICLHEIGRVSPQIVRLAAFTGLSVAFLATLLLVSSNPLCKKRDPLMKYSVPMAALLVLVLAQNAQRSLLNVLPIVVLNMSIKLSSVARMLPQMKRTNASAGLMNSSKPADTRQLAKWLSSAFARPPRGPKIACGLSVRPANAASTFCSTWANPNSPGEFTMPAKMPSRCCGTCCSGRPTPFRMHWKDETTFQTGVLSFDSLDPLRC